jgi:antirestriction protein ArdC
VKKRSRGCHVLYASTFSRIERDEDTGEEEEKKIPFLKGYTVFNVEQTEGLPATMYAVPETKPLDDAIEDVEAFIERISADVRYGADTACYRPKLDVIQLPEPSSFESAAHYYATSLHEHAHYSGAKHRLDRDLTIWSDTPGLAPSSETLISPTCPASTLGKHHLALLTRNRRSHRTVVERSQSRWRQAT